jgi:hypothetical protein
VNYICRLLAHPPPGIGQIAEGSRWFADVVPAPELLDWVSATFLQEESPLFNEDHLHLADADLVLM